MSGRWDEVSWYDEARCYDIVYEPFAAEEADFLEEVVRRYGKSGGRRVLEPGCGSGRLLREFERRGWCAAGFDDGAAMLRYARERREREGQRHGLFFARMEAFSVAPCFDLAHCLVSSFKHLPDEESARSHLECVARSLAPGGLYVIGLHLSDYGDETSDVETWAGEREGTRVRCRLEIGAPDAKSRTEHARARMLVEEGEASRRVEAHWDCRTYDAPELYALLRSVPAFELCGAYGFDYDLDDEFEPSDDRLDNVLVLRRRGDILLP